MNKKTLLFVLLSTIPACDAESGMDIENVEHRAGGMTIDDLDPVQLESLSTFSLSLEANLEGFEFELIPAFQFECKDGQSYELDSKQTTEDCLDGGLVRTTYTVRTTYVCVDGEWQEGTSVCPRDQPCFSVEETGEKC